MTKEELWKIYVTKNPQFGAEGARFTINASGIRKLFEQTWDLAEKHGRDSEKAAEGLKRRIDDVMAPFFKK